MNDLINDIQFSDCCNDLIKLRKVFIENNVKFNPCALGNYYAYFVEHFRIYQLCRSYQDNVKDVIMNKECSVYMKNLFGTYMFDLIKYCLSFLHSRYTKKSRLYERIDYMLNNYDVCYFCTFTFDNEHIDLDLKYKRKVLTQMLKCLDTCYIGNIDFGDLNGRMHFHVIIAENDIHICKKNIKWDFGFFDIQVISNKDSVRLGSYIMKLVNHAIKSTTKDSIITPRGKYSFNNLMNNC